MRGLYLNTDPNTMAASLAFFQAHNLQLSEQVAGQQVTLVYNRYDWSTPPLVEVSDEFGGGKIFCFGWFVFQSQRNNLEALVDAYLSQGDVVFAQIPLGVFVIAHISVDGKVKVITDAFGIATHYVRCQAGRLELAPTVKAFSNLPEPDPVMLQTIEAHNHLFGNFTAYPGIERVEPGASVDCQGKIQRYMHFDFTQSDPKGLESIPQEIAEVIDYWPKETRTLPISGGLDSRLTLAHREFQFGYTYGPEGSGDRPIARQFADCFEDYYEFEFSKPELLEQEKTFSDDYFFGVSKWLPRLMTVYYHTFNRCNGSYVLFDGYLGDVLQRGNYIKFAGVFGSLLKLFPWFYHLQFSPKRILRNRYKTIPQAAFEVLMKDFHQRTDHLDIHPYQKVIYYEFIYGRGGRFGINGSNITAGQFYTPIPFFLVKSVFEKLMSQKFVDTVQYKQVGRIWRKVPERFRNLVSDSGVSPVTPYWLIPFVNIFFRVRMHYVPGFGNYAQGKAKQR